jgi:hypothetical protein
MNNDPPNRKWDEPSNGTKLALIIPKQAIINVIQPQPNRICKFARIDFLIAWE